jgi:hypothetical protein
MLSLLSSLFLGFLVMSQCSAFAPHHQQPPRPTFGLPEESKNLAAKIAAASAFVIANVPVIASAVEDDYEYGAVDAPIGLAIGAGILAIGKLRSISLLSVLRLLL